MNAFLVQRETVFQCCVARQRCVEAGAAAAAAVAIGADHGGVTGGQVPDHRPLCQASHTQRTRLLDCDRRETEE